MHHNYVRLGLGSFGDHQSPHCRDLFARLALLARLALVILVARDVATSSILFSSFFSRRCFVNLNCPVAPLRALADLITASPAYLP